MAGGGSALLKVSYALDKLLREAVESNDLERGQEWYYGVKAVKQACYAPFNRIAINTIGKNDAAAALRTRVLEALPENPNFGIDFRKRDQR